MKLKLELPFVLLIGVLFLIGCTQQQPTTQNQTSTPPANNTQVQTPSNSSFAMMNLSILVYEQNDSYVSPPFHGIAGAKVEVYNYSYYHSNVSNRMPIETAYTDGGGIAMFSNLAVSDYELVVSKEGYLKSFGPIYGASGGGNTVIGLQHITPFAVTVKDVTYDNQNPTPLAGVKVDLYDDESGAFLKTVYTDSNGVANFGDVDIIWGKIEVSKEGYYNNTEHSYAYSRNVTINIYAPLGK